MSYISRAGRLAWVLSIIALIAIAAVLGFAAGPSWWAGQPVPASVPSPVSPVAAVVARGTRLHLAPDGYATPSCGHNDGRAVDFSFHYLADPADALQGDKLLMQGAAASPADAMTRTEFQRMLLERIFLVKVNTNLAEVLLPRRWEFSAQDIARNAITGGIFPTVAAKPDPLVSGHLLITSAGATGMEGSVDVVLQSGRWIREPFKVVLKPRNPDLICG